MVELLSAARTAERGGALMCITDTTTRPPETPMHRAAADGDVEALDRLIAAAIADDPTADAAEGTISSELLLLHLAPVSCIARAPRRTHC